MFLLCLWVKLSINMTILINTVIVMLFYYDSSSYFIHVQFVVLCVYVLLNHTFEYAFCGPWFENINLLYETRKNCFRYLKLTSPLNKWYYIKKQLFDLEVKGQGPTKVIHPHTKYHWPISKDKKVMVWTSFAEKKQKKRKQKKKSD